MRTRTGRCYTSDAESARRSKRRRIAVDDVETTPGFDFLDSLPEDLVLMILCKLSATATSPADLLSIRQSCKRLNQLARNPLVLFTASPMSVAVEASNWSVCAHRFLEQCAWAGNPEASYMLGMIRFYCMQDRAGGLKLMARAAIRFHAAALYSLAVIQFNGSGGTKDNKDLRAGVVFCARAAFLGHVDAMRELGHCLQDGYGVRQNVTRGRRFLVEANNRELASSTASTPPWHHRRQLLSDFGCSVPAPKPHPANQFLVDWFSRSGNIVTSCGGTDRLQLCSHNGCGRPETRRHEFRRCSVCGSVYYCSRACQALDWKLHHKIECVPMVPMPLQFDNAGVQGLGAADGGAALDAVDLLQPPIQ